MKIAYLGQMADVATENGISKKIRAQITAWQHLGHRVRYFSLVPTTERWSGLATLELELIARGNPVRRMLRSFELVRRIRAWGPDVIYLRYAYHEPGHPALFRRIPTVAEINSDDLAEYPITLGRAKQLYHRLTRARTLRAVAGLVPVTRELARRFAVFGHPAEVIANSVELDAFTIAPVPVPQSPTRLVFVGSAGTPWHGLERVVELGRLFPDVLIDVVGCGAEACPGAPATLRFHGQLTRAAYEPLLAGATAAIGTLGLFRKNMDEACPLKVREYLAMGLPVIGAYEDTDIAAGTDYFLRLPNNAAPLAGERERIVRWLAQWRGRRVSREAVQHLDAGVKERARLAFLEKIARPAQAAS